MEGAGDDSIQGFATEISVDVGEQIDFKVDTDASSYLVTIYRTGYYGGDGARRITTLTPSATLPQQPARVHQRRRRPSSTTAATGRSPPPGTFRATAVSGVYLARLSRPDNGDASQITFIVRDDDSDSDVVFQTSDTTWQAYNAYGGSSFYRGGPSGRAYKLSYNRPMLTRDGPGGRDFYFANEYPMVRFLERNGYDVSYLPASTPTATATCCATTGSSCPSGTTSTGAGRSARTSRPPATPACNLLFLSGNEVYWKTRFEPSAAPDNAPYRTLVSYKETWDNAKIGPLPGVDRHLAGPAVRPDVGQGAGRPENALTGTAYMVNYSDLPVTVTAAEGKHRLWRNTGLASMAGSTTAARPAHGGLRVRRGPRQRLAPARADPALHHDGRRPRVPPGLRHPGRARARTTHHLTLYRAAERCAGLRRRHRAVDLGPRRGARLAVRCPSRRTGGCSRRRSTCSPTWAPSPPR